MASAIPSIYLCRHFLQVLRRARVRNQQTGVSAGKMKGQILR
jgi:hypothetical protein